MQVLRVVPWCLLPFGKWFAPHGKFSAPDSMTPSVFGLMIMIPLRWASLHHFNTSLTRSMSRIYEPINGKHLKGDKK